MNRMEIVSGLKALQAHYEPTSPNHAVLEAALRALVGGGPMGGRSRPLTCCDRDCAEANGCRTGGRRCEICGLWHCARETDEDGLCPECAEETRRERIEEKRLELIIKEVQGDRKEKENDQSRDASV